MKLFSLYDDEEEFSPDANPDIKYSSVFNTSYMESRFSRK